jgi:hypothetical protein
MLSGIAKQQSSGKLLGGDRHRAKPERSCSVEKASPCSTVASKHVKSSAVCHPILSHFL